jgi:hypothetical protein
MGKTYRGITPDQRLEACRKHAYDKGGECLSNQYKNTATKLIWRCSFGHEWEALPANVLYKNKWCPKCAGNFKLTKDDADLLATSRMGLCLSEEPIRSVRKLKWRCQFGHEWEATYNNVKKGSWCPYCLGLFGETVVRLYFERYFEVKFSKVRPDWLNGLELDGYNKELSLAFEYNGPQHYRMDTPFSDRSIYERDKRKAALCREHGVELVVINYIPNNDVSIFTNRISEALEDHGFKRRHITIDVSEINPYRIKMCQDMAVAHGGLCLSKEYLGYDRKMHWRCKNGHEWYTTMYLVEKGHWCARCVNQRKRK